MRGAIYAAWAVFSVLAVLMFMQSAKELAPAEDQGVIFGVVNTLVKPVVKLLALPLIIITVGIALFFVNVLMLWITDAIGSFRT